MNKIEENDESKPPPSEVELMMNELENNKNDYKKLSPSEFDEILQHSKSYGYKPDFNSRRNLNYDLRKLLRQRAAS